MLIGFNIFGFNIFGICACVLCSVVTIEAFRPLLKDLEFDIFWVAGVFKSGTSMAHYMLRYSGSFPTILQKETFSIDSFVRPMLVTCPPTTFKGGLARLQGITKIKAYKTIGLILLRAFPDWKVACFRFWCDNQQYNCTEGAWSQTGQDTTFKRLNIILDGKLNNSRWHNGLTVPNFERYTYIKEALQFSDRLFVLDFALLDDPVVNPLAWLTGLNENLLINTNSHRGTENQAVARQYTKMPPHIKHKLQKVSYCECKVLISHGINFTDCGSFTIKCPFRQLNVISTVLAPGLVVLNKR